MTEFRKHSRRLVSSAFLSIYLYLKISIPAAHIAMTRRHMDTPNTNGCSNSAENPPSLSLKREESEEERRNPSSQGIYLLASLLARRYTIFSERERERERERRKKRSHRGLNSAQAAAVSPLFLVPAAICHHLLLLPPSSPSTKPQHTTTHATYNFVVPHSFLYRHICDTFLKSRICQKCHCKQTVSVTGVILSKYPCKSK